jgi:hypothetical protein
VSATGTVPEFVIVTLFPRLNVFVLIVPKDSVVGVIVITGVTPVPDRATALEARPVGARVRLDDFSPVVVGLKFTFTLHVAPTANVVEQLLV